MIQGSILKSFIHRKMTATDGVVISADKSCLIVPPVFTKGKSEVEKGSTFSFITEDTIILNENIATVEWHPDLYKFSAGSFNGTPVIGPLPVAQALRGTMEVKKSFNVKELPWIARIWVHSR